VRFRAFALIVLFVACGGRRTPSSANEPAQVGTTTSTPGDAGALTVRACIHGAKDLTPCGEDCDRGIASGCAILAEDAERAKSPTRAVVLHERACELKEASACVSAARMHAAGSGVPPSRKKQIDLLETACRLGDGFACSVPAKAYATGNGVARDEQRAHDLWQRACAAGVEQGCEEIGETQ